MFFFSMFVIYTTVPLCPFLPMLHWDEMDRHGGLEVQFRMFPLFPRYIGMGWTVGSRHEGWYSLGCSHSVPGTLGYMMGCDGMDSR